MEQQSDVFKDRFYIFSADVQSFKQYVLSFQDGYKTNVSLESLFYFVYIVYLFSTASSWIYRIKPWAKKKEKSFNLILSLKPY